MNTLNLLRLEDDGIQTVGIMFYFNGKKLFTSSTMELPWKFNRKDESCIPAGEYNWVRYFSPKHKREVILLQDVPNRKDIEIHIANYVSDLLGCIGVGSNFADINGDGEIDTTHSKDTFDAMMAILPKEGKIIIDDSRVRKQW